MQEEVSLYWNEDHTEYAVLVSRGFGAGFSTWECSTLAYDARVIEFYLQHKNDEEWMRTVEKFDPESPAHKEAKKFFKSLEYHDYYVHLHKKNKGFFYNLYNKIYMDHHVPHIYVFLRIINCVMVRIMSILFAKRA